MPTMIIASTSVVGQKVKTLPFNRTESKHFLMIGDSVNLHLDFDK